MSKRLVLESGLIAVALWLSGEMLWRRWLVGQVPTQVGPVVVYALIGVNVVVGAAQLRRLRRRRRV